jgi:glycine/serine hydroxymethyltransferase
MATIARLMARALRHRADDAELTLVRKEVGELCRRYPVYPGLRYGG